MRIDHCNQCGAEVVWVTSNRTGKRTMLDARPWATKGNVHLDTARMTYIVLEPELLAEARRRGFELYTNHFGTCPARERRPRYEETFGSEEKELYEHTS